MPSRDYFTEIYSFPQKYNIRNFFLTEREREREREHMSKMKGKAEEEGERAS